MPKISQFAAAFLLNALWQTALIAAVASLCAWLLRDSPARHRYLFWVCALILCVCAPVAGLLLPGTQTMMTLLPAEVAPARGASPEWLTAMLETEARPSATLPSLAVMAVWLYALFICWRLLVLWRAWRRTAQAALSASVRELPPRLQEVGRRCRAALGLAELPILCSGRSAAPLTLGAFRPVIILPEEMFESESAEVLTTALGHEMAHVRRRDFLVNLICELLYLPISFHPAAALVKRRINATRELACDEIVAERVMDAQDYARALVDIAGSISLQCRPDYTMGVFDADILEERVMRLMERRDRPAALRARLLLVLCALALALSGITAAAFSLTAEGPKAQKSADTAAIAGEWHLYVTRDGEDHKKEQESVGKHAITLSIKATGERLSGKAMIPKVIKREDGTPEFQEPIVLTLITPRFDGTHFHFKVDNGEELLDGKLKLVGDHFEGRWISTESRLSGTLKMVRKE